MLVSAFFFEPWWWRKLEQPSPPPRWMMQDEGGAKEVAKIMWDNGEALSVRSMHALGASNSGPRNPLRFRLPPIPSFVLVARLIAVWS